MNIELISPTKLAAVPNRQWESKMLQRENIRDYAVRHPEQTPEVDRVGPAAKTIELGPDQTHLRFETDKDTGVHLIKIVDTKSGEVVRQIPSEELLYITKSLQNLKGLLVSKES